MTKNAAIQSFFESFGLPVYPAVSVPTSGDEKPSFPYITYSAPTDSNMERTMVSASVWYRSESWTALNAMVDTISQYVGTRRTLECDEGGIIVRKGTPFAQPMGDDSDNMIKRKILNFEFLYATIY
jgi:hypothetical protein